QWVDAGTVSVLADLLRPPDPPRLLLVLSSRDEAAPVLERLAAEMRVERRRLDVGPLEESDAETLAASLLAGAPVRDDQRAAVGGGDAMLEPYHDRIRQFVLARLAEPDRARVHGAIARALEGRASSERLARHWAGAGEREKAAASALAAADESLATHHFDH